METNSGSTNRMLFLTAIITIILICLSALLAAADANPSLKQGNISFQVLFYNSSQIMMLFATTLFSYMLYRNAEAIKSLELSRESERKVVRIIARSPALGEFQVINLSLGPIYITEIRIITDLGQSGNYIKDGGLLNTGDSLDYVLFGITLNPPVVSGFNKAKLEIYYYSPFEKRSLNKSLDFQIEAPSMGKPRLSFQTEISIEGDI